MTNRPVFRFAIYSSLIVTIACISSCRSIKPPPLTEWQQESLRLEKERKRLTELSNVYRTQYAARYAAYRCENPGLPAVASHQLPLDDNHSVHVSKLCPIELAHGIVFRTQLGKAIRVGDRNDTFRTKTRHILEVAGKEVGRAESLLTWEGSGEVMGSSKIIFTETTNEVLVEEFIGGAGARYRHIAFMPVLTGASDTSAPQAKWRMVYVHLPSQTDIGSDCGILGKIHGLLNGKIYVEIDRQFYAFPVEDFVETKLEFTVG